MLEKLTGVKAPATVQPAAGGGAGGH